MKKLLIMAVLLTGAFAIGCKEEAALSVSGGRGVAYTQEERIRRIEMIADIQERMIQDDWDMIWLMDRSSALSEWHVYASE